MARSVVIGYCRGIQTGPAAFWVAGILGEPDEAQSFIDSCESRALLVNKRAAEARALVRLGFSDEADEALDVYETAVKRLKELDRKAKCQVIDYKIALGAGYALEYMVADGEVRGFFVEEVPSQESADEAKPMSSAPYRRIIREATDCNSEDSYEVENIMRDANGGVLDHLDRERFEAAAVSAYCDLQAIRVTQPEWSSDPVMAAARKARIDRAA